MHFCRRSAAGCLQFSMVPGDSKTVAKLLALFALFMEHRWTQLPFLAITCLARAAQYTPTDVRIVAMFSREPKLLKDFAGLH